MKYKMLDRGERIGVALSGGKDSLALLTVLSRLAPKINLKLEPILVDEGISNYREHTLRTAKEATEALGLPLHVIGFREVLGATLDEIVEKGEKNPCAYCGVFRRKLLNQKARELGLEKIATGHNLDDEVQAVMMNYLRGDLDRLKRLGIESRQGDFVRRIKPLRLLPEKEVALFVLLEGHQVSFDECPYASTAFRTQVREMVYDLENKNPGIRFSILAGWEKLLPLLAGHKTGGVKSCKNCGEPTSGTYCKACEFEEELGL